MPGPAYTEAWQRGYIAWLESVLRGPAENIGLAVPVVLRWRGGPKPLRRARTKTAR